MFFSGGTFGHESEVRESNRRQTGRRHQPRDMTAAQVAAVANTSAAARAESGRHANDQKQMSAGPSFMDRMYAHDGSSGDTANASRRPKAGPKDNLNIFAWKERDTAQATAAKPTRGPRAAREVSATAVPTTVEERRAVESRKFEANKESTFLRFSDAPASGASAAPTPSAAKGHRRTSATEMKEHGMMGELMRDQQQRPHGKRVQAEQPAKRRGGANSADDGVAGFPGMGKNSAPIGGTRLHRKPASTVSAGNAPLPASLPPWAQHDDIEESRVPQAGARQPTYHIDDADYEDRHPQYGSAPHGDMEADHQRRMQEIEMYDDGVDDDEPRYAAPQPHRQHDGQQHQPEWLDEPPHQQQQQQRHVQYDMQHQEYYDDEGEDEGHYEYH